MRLEREAALQGVQLQVAVIAGIRTGGVFSLAQGDFVIGRDEAGNQQIADEFVSLRHSGLRQPQRNDAQRRSDRVKGFTIRKIVDCWIATFCIERGFPLLHKDRDFDPFEQHLKLKVLR